MVGVKSLRCLDKTDARCLHARNYTFCSSISLDESILNVNFKMSEGCLVFQSSYRSRTDTKFYVLCHLNASVQAFGCPVTFLGQMTLYV